MNNEEFLKFLKATLETLNQHKENQTPEIKDAVWAIETTINLLIQRLETGPLEQQ